MFSYPAGKSYHDYDGHTQSNFRPLFATSVINSATPEAKALCGNNTNCLFDFHVTESRDIAMATLDFTVDLKEAEDASIPGTLKLCTGLNFEPMLYILINELWAFILVHDFQ